MNDTPVPTDPASASGTPTAPASGVTAPPPKRATRWVTPTLALIAVLAVGIFGGVLIGHATSSSNASAASGLSRGFGAAGGTGSTKGIGKAGFAGGSFTSGTIVSASGTTMVLKTKDGTQKTVTIAGSTAVTKTSKATVSELKAGQTVTVVGAAGSSGDIAATTISEGARGFGGRPHGGAAGAGSSSNG